MTAHEVFLASPYGVLEQPEGDGSRSLRVRHTDQVARRVTADEEGSKYVVPVPAINSGQIARAQREQFESGSR